MTESRSRYRRFERARHEIAEAREDARRRAEEERRNPRLFDLREIVEGDR